MRFSVGCDPGQGNGEIGEIVLWIPEYGREVQTHPLPWLPAACRTNHCGSQSSWQFGPKLWLVYRPGCHTSLGPAVQNYFLVFENAACLPHLTRAFAHDVSRCLGRTVCPPSFFIRRTSHSSSHVTDVTSSAEQSRQVYSHDTPTSHGHAIYSAGACTDTETRGFESQLCPRLFA